VGLGAQFDRAAPRLLRQVLAAARASVGREGFAFLGRLQAFDAGVDIESPA